MAVIMMVIGTNDYETSFSDDLMNDHTKQSLQGVSTLKLGLEYKPVSMLALRLGYNYVSPMFKESADRDQTIPSQGTIYATFYRLHQLEGDLTDLQPA